MHYLFYLSLPFAAFCYSLFLTPVHNGLPVHNRRSGTPGMGQHTDPYVLIRGGSFQMGSDEGLDDEQPIHTVRISDFYLSRYEITVDEFKAFVDDTGYKTDAEKGDGSYTWWKEQGCWKKYKGINWRHDAEGKLRTEAYFRYPVVHVSWNDANAYCSWLSGKTGQTYRLPTEAEWEYAAGNGSKHTRYSWGNGPAYPGCGNLLDLTAKGWMPGLTDFDNFSDGYVFTAAVGSFEPNEPGLYDMSGNVSEWCSDWHHIDYYKTSPSVDPPGSSWGLSRVVRGGSFYSMSRVCRVAYRYNSHSAGDRHATIGFRVARNL